MNTALAQAPVDLPEHIAAAIVDHKHYANVDGLCETYAWMRANNPLGRLNHPAFHPFWVVTKHADVMAISRDNALFTNGAYSPTCAPQAYLDHVLATQGTRHPIKSLIHVDGAEHKELRGLTQAWFMPNSILKLDERIKQLAQTSVDKLSSLSAQGQVVDFVNDVALYYPLHVIMDILGVPPEDELRMLKLTQELFGAEDPDLKRQSAAVSPEERAKVMMEVVGDFRNYFNALTEARRQDPRNDIATLLANGTVAGQPLDPLQLLGYYMIVATAGHDTTSSTATMAMHALATQPGLLQRLKDDPKLIPAFIDEAIRVATPVRHFMRTAMADTEIRGRTIREGDWLMLCYLSANRDEDVFANPNVFDIDRKPNRHLAFGFGGHVCLGQHLAKMELRILFEALIPRLQSVSLAGEMRMTATLFVGGPKTLPLHCVVS
ncbi:cytochrome P450 [Comamonas serinivorans]|uniref:Cytochrome P450 n=1 Tax=Comamonas serinivorans TaxID=1082851 RepID=A0A1Y0ELY5_9BURK|nr:cytochrome P450 [Comamonas serinivorans]ARU04653.1 cytochrome P450 [Comamonas serinivorans]